MEIIGPDIEPVRAVWGADHQRLEEARGLQLSHQTARLDRVLGGSVTIAILDSQWDVLGVEQLKYVTLDVNCVEVDSL